MAKLGSDKHPLVVRVQTMERLAEVVGLCDDHGWEVIGGVEPDEPEDISDLRRALQQERAAKLPAPKP